MDDPVQWALAIASFMLALFALGAVLGWRFVLVANVVVFAAELRQRHQHRQA